MQISRINEMLHRFLAPYIRPGDMAVDCTVGNGHDFLFLASCVGPGGRLFGFDIQGEAIIGTRKRLAETGMPEEPISLIQESHEHLDRYVGDGVRVFMYNLGYLPGGHRHITTRAETTLASLEKALPRLCPGGLASLVIYTGHEHGRTEAGRVRSFAEQLPMEDCRVLCMDFLNMKKDPPSIILIQRNEQ